MDIVSIIASVNAIIIAFLISRKKQKSISDFILIEWVINFAFHFAIPWFIGHNLFFHESLWGFILGISVVAHAPFVFVYTNSLIKPDFKLNFKNLYHFGFILIFISSFIPYLLSTPEERMSLVYEKQNLSYQVLLPMLMLLFIRLYFLIRTLFILFKHQHNIKQSFSYESKVDLSWIKLIVYGFLGAIALSFVLYGLVSAQVINILWMDYILIIINIILFYFIAYSGYKQATVKGVIVNPAKKENTENLDVILLPESDSTAKKDTDYNNPVISKLLQVMDREKLFLDSELNIGMIANKLDIHAHQLSKLINHQVGKNFFEFVNEYRVEEFKRIATNPKNKNISILGLAYDAGFNSKATFYRFFKNKTGLTPSEFMESYKF